MKPSPNYDPDNSHDPVLNLQASPADQILIYLAMTVMKIGGHRYGAFLDAATTAAKLAIYSTYLEQRKNIRKTGFLYHVEPKRVKAIVKEIEQAFANGQMLRILSSQESYYLIALPHLWQEKYAHTPPSPRLQVRGLTPSERKQIEASLPPNLPPARLLDEVEFLNLIQLLHELSQAELPEGQRMAFSDALSEHIKFRLLHSGTVIQVDSPLLEIPVFALAQRVYSPKGERERVITMIDDVARFFSLLQGWVHEEPGVLRAIEVLDIDPEQQDAALQELDKMLQAWADKYHVDGGIPMVMHLAAGNRKLD